MLSGKVAVITGGARGIGKSIALKFARAGCCPVLADVRDDEGMQTASLISEEGCDAVFYKCDVSDNSKVQKMMNQVIDRFGRIDILVNNAGLAGGAPRSITDISEEEWDRILDVNLKGTYLCCRAVVPYMKDKAYGKIINVASLAAVAPPGSVTHYVSAKAGVVALTRDLALELAPFNICVNAILPGLILTEIWNDVLPSNLDKNALIAQMAKDIPMRRVGTPEDVAGVALFLASDLSGYVTGDRILVTGGAPLIRRL